MRLSDLPDAISSAQNKQRCHWTSICCSPHCAISGFACIQGEEGVPLILLIEDDADDVFFFRRTLSKLGYHADVRVVSSSAEAKRYMLNDGEFQNATYFRKPDLIVSDFRLAGDTALGFVQWLRTYPQFTDVPVVMLSGAASQMDTALFVGLSVKSFVRKTADVTVLGTNLQPHLP